MVFSFLDCMLKARPLAGVLRQALGAGVDAVVLMNASGAVICSVSNESAVSNAHLCDAPILLAVMSHAWRGFASCEPSSEDTAVSSGSSLEALMLDTPTTKTILMGVANGAVILALIAQQDVEVGMLRLKATALQRHLHEPMSRAFAA